MHKVEFDADRAVFFDDLSDTWDTSGPSPDPAIVLRFLSELNISPEKTVLDVGTGTGLLIEHIFSFHPARVIALDLSIRMLEKLKSKYSSRFDGQLEIMRGDVHLLNLPDAAIDIAVCNGVYPHFQDKALALSQLRRVLKKGGTLAVNHFAGREFINNIHGKSSHALICQDLLDPIMILSDTFSRNGFRPWKWRDDLSEYFMIAEKI